MIVMKHTQFLRVLFALVIVCIFTSTVSAHYRPGLGRWMERDPLVYVSGSNLFEYAQSAPIDAFDPLGLDAGWGRRRYPDPWGEKTSPPIRPPTPWDRFVDSLLKYLEDICERYGSCSDHCIKRVRDEDGTWKEEHTPITCDVETCKREAAAIADAYHKSLFPLRRKASYPKCFEIATDVSKAIDKLGDLNCWSYARIRRDNSGGHNFVILGHQCKKRNNYHVPQIMFDPWSPLPKPPGSISPEWEPIPPGYQDDPWEPQDDRAYPFRHRFCPRDGEIVWN